MSMIIFGIKQFFFNCFDGNIVFNFKEVWFYFLKFFRVNVLEEIGGWQNEEEKSDDCDSKICLVGWVGRCWVVIYGVWYWRWWLKQGCKDDVDKKY